MNLPDHKRVGTGGLSQYLPLVALALAMAMAPPPAKADASFALVAPERVAALASRRDTPEAKTAIRIAGRSLERAPQPQSHIHVEGTLPHQGIYDASDAAKRDWPIALDLALAFRLSGEAGFEDQARRYLRAWLDLYVVGFNPIDETELDQLIVAYDLLRDRLGEADQTKMRAFLSTMAKGYIAHIAGAKRSDLGNWQSHRVKLVTLAAYALGDSGLIDQARDLYRAHIGRNIGGDGAVWDFSERNALHYVTYDLEPLSMAALAAKGHGEDWYAYEAPNGGSLAKALAWLVPYADGRRNHEEFVGSKVKFDYERRAAGVAGFAGMWEPKSATYLYGLASHLDARYLPLAAALSGWHRPWLALCLD